MVIAPKSLLYISAFWLSVIPLWPAEASSMENVFPEGTSPLGGAIPNIEMPAVMGIPKTASSLDLVESAQASSPEVEDEVVELEVFRVTEKVEEEDYDITGIGMDDADRADPMFANADMMEDLGSDVLPEAELDMQMELASGNSAADITAGVERVNLRGFTTPISRDSYSQAGFPGGLPSVSSETIRGLMVPVVGRAAPGGIRNNFSGRPRGRNLGSVALDASTNQRFSGNLVSSGDVIPRKAWHYVNVRGQYSEGPQPYAYQTQLRGTAALAIRHTRRTSSLFTFDVINTNGNPAAGVPNYRHSKARDEKTIGPYLPLVNFSLNGPNTSLWTRYLSFAARVESRPSKEIDLKAMIHGVKRDVLRERFSTGYYVVSEGKFNGVREPIHYEESFEGLMSEVNLTWKPKTFGIYHKILFGLEALIMNRGKHERRLQNPKEAQPESVWNFDPYNPDYYRVPYSPETYSRITTDQNTHNFYSGAQFSTRSSFGRGKTVVTFGARYDRADISVTDYRPSAPQPKASQVNSQVSYHAGLNHLMFRNRLMWFASASSAFDSDPIVDQRTGKIHGNESTKGVELGFKTVLQDKRFHFTVLSFYYTNENIPIGNPLYNDKDHDAGQTQPRYLDSGEECFQGVQLKLGWNFHPGWMLSFKSTYVKSETKNSPIITEEGNIIPRQPENTITAGLRYRVPDGPLKGLSFGTTLTFFDHIIVRYETSTYEQLEYPAYALIGFNASYTWTKGKYRNRVSLNLRNTFDTDLERKIYRVGAGRELFVSWRISI